MNLFNEINKGNINPVQALIKQGYDINQTDITGYTFLYYAVICNQIDIVKELLKMNADVNFITPQNNTALHFTCCLEKVNVIITEILLNNGANINHQNSQGFTALYLACRCCFYDKIEMLLNYGADYKIKTNANQSIIDVADSNTVKFIHFCLVKKELHLLWELNSCD